jgi:hypothetical protein
MRSAVLSYLHVDRADIAKLTIEALQVYYANVNRNSVPYFEYGSGIRMKILKGISECVS